MVHAPPGGATPPLREDDVGPPQLLTDERGRRYALVPLGGDAARGELHSAPAAATLRAIAAWRLTPREVEVAVRVARGLTNKRIASECGIREGTVKSHIHRLFHKLRATSRVELVLRLQEGAGRDDAIRGAPTLHPESGRAAADEGSRVPAG